MRLKVAFVILTGVALIFNLIPLPTMTVFLDYGKLVNRKEERFSFSYSSLTSSNQVTVPPDLMKIQHTCSNLWSTNVTEDILNTSLRSSMHKLGLEGKFDLIAESCENYFEFRKGFYNSEPITETEKNFPIAYSILVYHSFEQIEQLLMALYRTQNFYCFHVDRKVKELFLLKMKKLVSCFPDNVFISRRRFDIEWGRFSLVEAELSCMQQLLQKKSNSTTWKYFINLTGEEFPLVTNLELVSVLSELKGANLLDGPEIIWNRSGRFPETIPNNLTIYKSSTHLTLSREAVQFLLKDKLAKDLFSAFKPHWFAEESIFAILQYNPQSKFPGGLLIPGDDERILNQRANRYKQWIMFPKDVCLSHRIKRSICMIGVKTLPEIVNNIYGTRLFANKFPWNFQPMAWDCMQAWHHSKVMNELQTKTVATDFYSILKGSQVEWARKTS